MTFRHYLALIFAFFALGVLISSEANAQSYGNYYYRKKLVLNSDTYVSGSSDLTNFPVLLSITDTDLIRTGNGADKLQSSTANDIAFTDASDSDQEHTTEYGYQIDSYNATTGELKVWVVIPSLKNNSNNEVYFYFGSTSPTTHPTASATWGTDYKAVYHFNESTYSNGGTVVDGKGSYNATLTSNANNLTTGYIGNAYSFDGTANKYIQTSSYIPTPNTGFTISAWVKSSSISSNQKIVTNQYPYGQGFSEAGRGFKMGLDGSKPEAEVTGQKVNSGSSLNSNQWYHIQTVFTSNTLYTYVDGVLHSSGWGGSPTVDGYKLRIGIVEDLNGYAFNGIIDEVRVLSVAKSADWIATEYNNQRYPGHGGNGTGLSGGYPFIYSYGSLEIVNTPPVVISDANAATNTIKENSTTGTVVGITASANFGVGHTTSYSLTDNASGRFAINASTGVVTVATSNFDYELSTSHSITVSATDGTDVITQTFSIAVTDIFDGFSSSYLLQKAITLNNNLLGISGDLTNYPVLLKVQDNNLIPAVANCGASVLSASSTPDVAFVDPSSPTTELNYEVESYNPTTGTLLVWVKIPTLKASGTNTLYMYFGTATPSSAHNAAFAKATWSNVTGSSSSFKGVWHFNENPASTSILDATSVGNNLNQSTNASLNTSSLIGNGVSFSNGALYKTGISGLPVNNSSQSIAFWAYYDTTPGTANMVSLQNASSSSAFQFGPRNSDIWVWKWGGITPLVQYNPKPSAGAWHYYVFTYNTSGNVSKMYIDGALANSNNAETPLNVTPNAIAFGAYLETDNTPGTGERFTGSIDEAQIIDVTLSDDWIKASYVIQSNPEAFINNGDLEPVYANVSTMPGALVYTWTGASSTDANDAANWTNTTTGSTGRLPLSNGYATVIIPSGLSRYPVLSANLSAYGLTLASGASLSLNGYQLNVKCNFYNNGTLLYNSNISSTLAFNGAQATQTYYGNSTTAEVGNLTIANTGGSVNLSGGGIDVYNLLTLSNNTFYPNSLLTLKASATQTAGVAGIPDGVTISGNMHVETYFSGGSGSLRGTRSISSPMNETLSGLTTYQQLKNYVIITGPGGASKGFDPGGLINPEAASLTRYNEPATNAQSQFTSVSDITEALPAGFGVFLYYRGNRVGYTPETATSYNKLVAPFADPENTVVKYTGVINQGDILVNLSYTNNPGETSRNGYNLIGNPYPAVIDWQDVDKVNLAENTVIIAKPTGGFAVSNDGVTIPSGMNLRYIQPGTGFYVKAAGSGASVTFKERNKVAPISTPTRLLSAPVKDALISFNGEPVKAKASATVSKLLRLSLQDKSFTEEAVIVFGEAYSTKATKEDASLFGGTTITLSTLSSDNVKLSINRQPLITSRTVIPVSINALSSGDVKLSFTDLSALENAQLYLVDKYLNKTVEINSTNNAYAFTITKTISSSFGDNRLELVISPPTVLPLHLAYFNGRKNDEKIKLVWATQSEKGAKEFIIEKSVNGTDFSTLAKVKATGNSSTESQYAVADLQPSAGLNYYKLTLIDENENVVYSTIASVNYSLEAVVRLSVYPNPSKEVVNVAYPYSYKSVTIEIIAQDGRVVKQKVFKDAEALQLAIADLQNGSYILRLKDAANANVQNVQFIKY